MGQVSLQPAADSPPRFPWQLRKENSFGNYHVRPKDLQFRLVLSLRV